MNWFNRHIAAILLPVSLVIGPTARAQVTPPPPAVPERPDEPLPEWKPPPPPKDVVHIDLTPELRRAQALRQAGLWFASLGGAQMFLGGILFAWAANVNDTLSHFHNETRPTPDGNFEVVGVAAFDPRLEDQRDRALAASQSMLIIGGAFLVTGFTLFGVGQARIRQSHAAHPRDPLPPLSGYAR
jgi:hypothetical protein